MNSFDQEHKNPTFLYRTEAFSGSQVRNAAEIMAYETFEMCNTDILECLKNSLLKGRPICETICSYLDEMESNGFVDDMSCDEKVDFFRGVLKEIEEVTGIQVNYALWLAEKDTVLNFYGHDMLDQNDYDAYTVGPVILSYLGREGTLYGYTELPAPLDKQEIMEITPHSTAESKQSTTNLTDRIKDASVRASALPVAGNQNSKSLTH